MKREFQIMLNFNHRYTLLNVDWTPILEIYNLGGRVGEVKFLSRLRIQSLGFCLNFQFVGPADKHLPDVTLV
jgi:hypothetical protein